MSQAEELLNMMSSSMPVHSHPVPDTDTYFVIDPITRKIENTNRKKSVIMQYDHNSERFTFELPRYIDGHDMLECTSITVNVDNVEAVASDGIEVVEPRINSDAPDMTDLRAHPEDPDKVISSWLISRNSTQLAGILSFSIEYKCTDSIGNVVYEWSTDKYEEIEVKSRKKNGEAAISEHTDLLEQWRSQIFGAGDSVMANIAAEGEAQVNAVKAESETQQEVVELKGAQTLDSIPEDYTEVDAMADEAVRSKGDAIVCEVSGESIVLKDSSNDHVRGLKLFGKSSQVTTTGAQLFDASKLPSKELHGCSVTNNGDGSFTISGSDMLSGDFIWHKDYTHEETISILKAGDLFFNIEKTTYPYLYISIRSESGALGEITNITETNIKKTVTQEMLDDETVYIRIGFWGTSNKLLVPGTIRPMLYQKGDGVWEPYTGGKPGPNPDYPQEIVSIENPTVNIYGKNLFDMSKINTTDTITLMPDGTLSVSHYYNRTQCTLQDLVPGLSIGTKCVLHIDTDGCEFIYLTKYGKIWSNNEVVEITEDILNSDICLYGSEEQVDGSTTIRTIQLVVNGQSREYEKYADTQKMSIHSTLPGIPVTSGGNYTDAGGQQWICDEVDLERGVYVQRVKSLVLDGSHQLNLYTFNETKGISIYDVLDNVYHRTTGFCTHSDIALASYHETPCMWIGVGNAALYWVGVLDALGYSTIDDMQAYVVEQFNQGTPVTILYPAGNPIETPLTAEEIAAFKALKTNYPNTTILNDAGAWMSVKYNADTKTYVENPKILKLTDSSTGVVYELKIVDGNLTIVPI